MHQVQPSSVNTWAAADAAVSQQLAVYVFTVRAAAAVQAREPHPHEEQPESTVTPILAVAAATSPPISPPSTGGVWACIANAETGGDVTMHGSVYSTAFGLMNQIVTDYGTPEVAARIFAGQGTFAEELDIATRFAADNGFGGWGERTKQKCGL